MIDVNYYYYWNKTDTYQLTGYLIQLKLRKTPLPLKKTYWENKLTIQFYLEKCEVKKNY